MVYVCPTCNTEVAENDEASHLMGHIMSDVTGALSHNEAFDLAADLTKIAVTTGKPIGDVMNVYKEAVRLLMESGLFTR